MSESLSSSRPWNIVIVGFDHMHAGDQITAITAHPRAVLTGTWDTDRSRMDSVCDDLGVTTDVRFDDIDRLVEQAAPDVAVICSTTDKHRQFAEYFAERGVHILLEKPLASSLVDARATLEAAKKASVLLGVNWPLAWYPAHRTTRRLISEGRIGRVTEVHYYDGNRGPLFHTHSKQEIDPVAVQAAKAGSWWYSAAHGGGSLRDYLGYGSTLATWFRDGELPIDVLARSYVSAGDEVDEQSVVISNYSSGLSTFQTRWGTFTDPWTNQPWPRCGFVIVGEEGTIASFDFADSVVMQTRVEQAGIHISVDVLPIEETGGVANLIAALDAGTALEGPISAETSFAGQRIVEAALRSTERRTIVRLSEVQ